ncbi:hypothetical protein ONZ45_g1088 [Pleurotus djamor]|nr:hypothetical protein ONZ45_g1088 [Pleurotus djamor]
MLDFQPSLSSFIVIFIDTNANTSHGTLRVHASEKISAQRKEGGQGARLLINASIPVLIVESEVRKLGNSAGPAARDQRNMEEVLTGGVDGSGTEQKYDNVGQEWDRDA